MTLEFLLTSLVIVIAPGTGVLYTLAAGLSRGARISVVAAFACTLGIVPHMVAAVTGLAALLHTSALAFQSLKIVGVLYLLYLAWSMIRERGALVIDEQPPRKSAGDIIVTGILVNVLNPKLSIFFFAFLPQFISPQEPHALAAMLEMSAVFMAMTFVVFVGYGVFAAWIRTWLMSRPRILTWMNRCFAGVFVLLGVKLALADR
ncbi:Homoserine/homoserine lactone efflux protein [Hartmannibacter diazotrophicus]|uniref:Homoserine/homoserine lactone efflux protein n=1 Tax=Hartmannibacter diazotrophicus TaxID=1482074 RepID=A0A2C9D3V1_9HYPH|nr:LysE family translocator [Hartmannibacter diazotrophicus]SON54481.1 Homoserine/homoserine lactone efflux protein [Hartmannibacter diazotrophicus]